MKPEKAEDLVEIPTPIEPQETITNAEMISVIRDKLNQLIEYINVLVEETKKLKIK